MTEEKFDRDERYIESLLGVLREGMIAKNFEMHDKILSACEDNMVSEESFLGVIEGLGNFATPTYIEPFRNRLYEDPSLDTAILLLGEICEDYDAFLENTLSEIEFLNISKYDVDADAEKIIEYDTVEDLIEHLRRSTKGCKVKMIILKDEDDAEDSEK